MELAGVAVAKVGKECFVGFFDDSEKRGGPGVKTVCGVKVGIVVDIR